MQRNFYVKRGWLGFLATALFLSGTAFAGSSTIAYQGVLRNAAGVVVPNNSYNMIFSLWNAVSGGSQVWTETHSGVVVQSGVISVQLGETTSFGTIFADNSNLWLQIAVDTGSGMQAYDPRVPLSSVPYARHAEQVTNVASATNAGNADTLNSQHAAAFAAAAHNHAGEDFTSGALSTDRYSAYNDLSAESKIGAGTAQISVGDHRHSALPYFIGQVGAEKSGQKTLATQSASGISNTGNALVAPVTGMYFVHIQQLHQANSSHSLYLALRVNGSTYTHAYLPTNAFADMIVSRYVYLNVGDQVSFAIATGPEGGSAANSWGGEHSSVSMYLLG